MLWLNLTYIITTVYRYGCFEKVLHVMEEHEGGLDKFSRGYDYFGCHVAADNGVHWREWAPGAEGLFLRGDFSKCASDIMNLKYA